MSEASNHSDLLDEVGRFARGQENFDRDRFDERLERLCKGELSADEHEQLLRDVEGSEELRLDYETFKPLGDDFQRKILDQFQRAGPGPGESSDPEVDEKPKSENREEGSVLRPPWWSRPFAVFPLAATLLAVLGGLWIWQAQAPIPFGETGLATYRMEILGGRNSVRSSRPQDSEPRTELPTFAVGDRLQLSLKPETESSEEVQVQLFVIDNAGGISPWSASKRFDPNGVVDIDGILGPELDLEPGEYRLVVLYGLPGRLPENPSLEQPASDGDGPWRVVEAGFRILPPEWSATGELPLEVQFAGCFAVGPGPSCVPYGELTLWVRSDPGADFRLYLDGEPVDTEPTEIDQGFRFTLPVKAASRSLEIRASLGHLESGYAIGLVPSELPEWLKKAQLLGSQGSRGEALAELEKADPSPEEEGAVLSLKARLADDESVRDELLAEALSAHCRQQNWLSRAYDLGMLVHAFLRRREFEKARYYLGSEVCSGSDYPAEAEILKSYYLGILHNDTGNYREAMAALRRGETLARRLGLTGEEVKTQLQIALTFERVGRGAEAAEQLEALAEKGFEQSLRPCDRARFHNSLAWAMIHVERATSDGEVSPTHDPMYWLDRADELALSNGCGDDLILDLRINRALGLERSGRTGEAFAALGEALEFEPAASSFHRLWMSDVEGRILLQEDRPDEALASYSEMEELARRAFDPYGLWRAKVQSAAAYEALNRPDRAVETYAEAEALLADQRLQIPLDSGREMFLNHREAETRKYLDLLLRLGLSAEAAEVARRSRARALGAIRLGHRLTRLSEQDQLAWDLAISEYLSLRNRIESDVESDRFRVDSEMSAARAKRAEWERESMASLDRAFSVLAPERNGRVSLISGGVQPPDLSPPAADEIMLVYHPLPAGWIGFALRSDDLSLHRFELPPATDLSKPGDLSRDQKNALSRLLLEPFTAGLKARQRVKVLAFGALQALDFHALPWAGDVLLASHVVAYGLDLGAVRSETAASARALVVVDPTETLALAAQEASRVESALGRHFRQVDRLSGREARLMDLVKKIPEVDWLHFVGHSRAGGPFGWDSSIELADKSRLTVGDILSLLRSPSRVVMASCQGAEVSEASTAGLGLAQAFVIAGAEQVIASTRSVEDGHALALLAKLYEQDRLTEDLAIGLRRAQLAMRGSGTDAKEIDWAAFRALVP